MDDFMFSKSARAKIQKGQKGREEAVVGENEHCAPGIYEVHSFGRTKCFKVGDSFIRIQDLSPGDSKLSHSSHAPSSAHVTPQKPLSASAHSQITPSLGTPPTRFVPDPRREVLKIDPPSNFCFALSTPSSPPPPFHERVIALLAVLPLPLIFVKPFIWALAFTLLGWLVLFIHAIRAAYYVFYHYPIQVKDILGLVASLYFLIVCSFHLGPPFIEASSILFYAAYLGFTVFQEVQFYRSSPSTWPRPFGLL